MATVPRAAGVTAVMLSVLPSRSTSLASTSIVIDWFSPVVAESALATGGLFAGGPMTASWATVTASTVGVTDVLVVLKSSRYCRYRPAGLVIALPLTVSGADQALQPMALLEVLVRASTAVPAGTLPSQRSVVHVVD